MMSENNIVGLLSCIYDIACQSDKWRNLEQESDEPTSKDTENREGKYLELDEVGERNKRTKELQTYFDDLVRDLQDEMMQVQKLRSSLRFFYRSHGFTLDPKAVDYFIPPNNSDYIVNIDQTLASRKLFQQVRKKDASLILQEEGEKDGISYLSCWDTNPMIYPMN